MEAFNNVASSAQGLPGHLDYNPFGATFTDPAAESFWDWFSGNNSSNNVLSVATPYEAMGVYAGIGMNANVGKPSNTGKSKLSLAPVDVTIDLQSRDRTDEAERSTMPKETIWSGNSASLDYVLLLVRQKADGHEVKRLTLTCIAESRAWPTLAQMIS